jgi:Zn-dependent membrane protease YugP
MFLPILLFVGTMAISLLATLRVKAAYARYSRLPASSGYSGAEAADQILHAAGIHCGICCRC